MLFDLFLKLQILLWIGLLADEEEVSNLGRLTNNLTGSGVGQRASNAWAESTRSCTKDEEEGHYTRLQAVRHWKAAVKADSLHRGVCDKRKLPEKSEISGKNQAKQPWDRR